MQMEAPTQYRKPLAELDSPAKELNGAQGRH